MSEYIKTSDIRKLISAAKYGDICSIDDLTNGNQDLTNVLKYVGAEVLDLVRCGECAYYRLRERDGELIQSYCIGPPGTPCTCRDPWDYCSRGRRKMK